MIPALLAARVRNPPRHRPNREPPRIKKDASNQKPFSLQAIHSLRDSAEGNHLLSSFGCARMQTCRLVRMADAVPRKGFVADRAEKQVAPGLGSVICLRGREIAIFGSSGRVDMFAARAGRVRSIPLGVVRGVRVAHERGAASMSKNFRCLVIARSRVSR
jgi:hypothetical protein